MTSTRSILNQACATRACGLILLAFTLTALVISRGQDHAGHGGHGGPPSPSGCDLFKSSNLVVSLRPFVDKLPIPRIAQPARTNFSYQVPVAPALQFTSGLPEYDMPMVMITNHQFHADLPPVEVWGYDGSYPGPTFDVNTNAPIL